MKNNRSSNRQGSAPIEFTGTVRTDTDTKMSSGRAGVAHPVMHIPVLRGDSLSGSVGLDIKLGDMPKPLLNGVVANVQTWFVPKSAHPQFTGHDEFMASYQGQQIKSLKAGVSDFRDPPPFYHVIDQPADIATCEASTFFRALGIHLDDRPINADLIDSYNLVFNHRAASHSSKIQRRVYAAENLASALSLAPAFWPSGRLKHVVPDYDRALILGELDLDITGGAVPIEGIVRAGADFSPGATDMYAVGNHVWLRDADLGTNHLRFRIDDESYGIIAQLQDQTISSSLADIDRARTTKAFAKARQRLSGNDSTGFNNDDTLMAELMQGLTVPMEQFNRPYLLNSAKVPFGFAQRFSSDAGALDTSLSRGIASVNYNINLPKTETGGTVITILEVLPERLYERMSDESLHITTPRDLPDALRDVQRTEPVDQVLARRVDARHTDGDSLYGYEPMNAKWIRDFTRMGGNYYQADPNAPANEQRSGVWMAEVVDPNFNEDHFLAPQPFPHTPFAVTTDPAFELTARHFTRIVGLTQMGDMLEENNSDYAAVDAYVPELLTGE